MTLITSSMRRTLNHFCQKITLDVRNEMSTSLTKHGTQRLPHVSPGWGSHADGGVAYRASVADFARRECQEASAIGTCSWEDVLLEEVYEALAEDDLAARRAELIQVMNVCALEIDQIDEELASNALEVGSGTCTSTAPAQASTATPDGKPE